ncbi:MAG: response regulator [Pseudomonadota bacterium]
MANTILIIENDQLVSAAMSQRLASFGFDVFTASDVGEADSIANENHPDVVLIDTSFTRDQLGGNVLETSAWASEVPIVLVAESERQVDVHESVNACGLLAMPFSGNDLLDSVSNALWQDAEAANEPW